jgi:hypothetical protein
MRSFKMGLFTKSLFKSYSIKESELIEKHISKYFGEIDHVIHEIVSTDIHLDIYVIKPTEEYNFYKLVTCGMGANEMNVPSNLKSKNISRAELLITLPSDWEIDSTDEKWYWPIRLLKTLSRLPIESNSWLCFGHTVSNQKAYDSSTNLFGAYIYLPYIAKQNMESFNAKIGLFKDVKFYQVIPIYEDEMNFKLENGFEKFDELFPEDFDMVIDPNRPSFIK